MNQNWIVENLNNAFSTWNGKLTELWGLVTTSPQTFKGGAVWGVMQSLHNALIGMRVMANCYMDSSAATWVYFDEIHVLLKDSMSADFLNSTWKRFRKYNAYATGITQDIQDYLANPIANALLSNSEFVIMLRQTKSLDALKVCTGYPTRSWNFCATPARDTASSRWATVYYHSPIWNPRIVMSISSSQRNREKGRSRNDFA